MRWLFSRCRRFIQSLLLWGETPAPSGTIFPTLLLHALRERYDIPDAGARDGALNYPPTSARTPVALEHDIAQHIANAVRTAAAQCHQVLHELIADLQANRVAQVPVGVKARLDRVLTTLHLAVRCRPHALHLLVMELREQIGAFNAFKRRERLTRPARQPESSLALVVFVALLIAVEAVLNGTLFSVSLDGGYLQGVLYALTLSVVNVGTSWLLGRGGLPFTNARHPALRAIGWLSGAVFVVWAVTLNLAVAHYRSSLASQVADPGHAAITRLMSQPLNLPDLNDLLLLIVGIVFAGLACWDGFRFGDPHPGFGPLTRDVRRAHEDYAAALDERNADLEEVRGIGINVLESADRELALRARRVAHVHAMQRDLRLRLAEYEAEAGRLGQMLIDEYRAANEAARSDPPPAYFATRVVLPPVTLEPIALEPIDVSDALETLEHYRKELDRRFVEAATVETIELVEEGAGYVAHPEVTTA